MAELGWWPRRASSLALRAARSPVCQVLPSEFQAPGVDLFGRAGSGPGWPSLDTFSLSPLRTRFGFARDPLTRRFGSTSRSVRVSGCCGGARSAGPPRGCRLSWALLTLRRLRLRCDRVGGRAHGFASRRARVAGGARLSVPPRRRSGGGLRSHPMPASFGERLLPVPFVRACCQRTRSP